MGATQNGYRDRSSAAECPIIFRASSNPADEALTGSSDHQRKIETTEALQVIEKGEVLLQRFAEPYARVDDYPIAFDAS